MTILNRKGICTFLVVTTFFFIPFLFYAADSAALSIPTIYGLRTYTTIMATGNRTTTNGISGGSETGSVPVEVLGVYPPNPIRLNKAIVNIPGDYGIPGYKYNTYTFRIRFYQAPYNYNGNMIGSTWDNVGFYTLSYRIKQTQRSESVACSLYYSDPATREWSCSFSLSDYNTIDYMTFIGGSDDSRWGIILQSFVTNPNPVLINFVDINAEGSQDPMIAGQQTIINQNQTIIDQNQQIIDSQNQTNDWLQDNTPPNVDTSSLGNSVGWLPPGPVDSILTLPLQLLQGIVNVFTNTAACSPLILPVPFTDKNFELPCINNLMDQIGFTPIWGLVGGVISALIIWNTLKWLYKFVDDTLTFRENNSGMWGGL